MPQLEYVNQLLASQPTDISLQHYYRPGGGEVPINRPWEILYDMIPLCADRAEGNLLRNDFVQNDIRKLLCSVNHGREKMTQRDFVENLGIESEYENCAEFSSHEFTLLKMLRREQLAAKFYKWASCEVVTTILYNTAVRRLDNPNLDIKPRGYRAIVRRLSPIDIQISQNPQMQVSEDKSGVMTLKINPTINDDINLPSEKALQEELFELLRLPVGIKHVKQVYKAVYDFAACTCVGINRKSDEFLDRRWDSLRRAVSYKNAKHIRGGIQVSKTIEQIPNAEALSTCKSQRSMVTMITSSNESSSITSSIPTSVPCPETRSCSSIPPRYEILDLATLDALLDHAASFRKGTHGKWHSIMALYSQMNPTGNMDLNKLRCRLNGERLRRSQSKSFESNKTTNQAVSVTHLPQEAPSGREQQHQSVVKDTRAACPSCNKRKRGCGPNSTNPSCEYRNKAQKQTITSYFTSN